MNCSTSEIEVREIEDAMRKITENIPETHLDCLVLTSREYVALRKEFDVKWAPTPPDHFRICGLPVECYPTREEVLERAHELCKKGKRVGIIRDPERPSCKNASPSSLSLSCSPA